MSVQHENAAQEKLFSVYVPTNHIYVGDIFLLGKEDVIHTNLSVREGLGKLTAVKEPKNIRGSLHLRRIPPSLSDATILSYPCSAGVL